MKSMKYLHLKQFTKKAQIVFIGLLKNQTVAQEE